MYCAHESATQCEYCELVCGVYICKCKIDGITTILTMVIKSQLRKISVDFITLSHLFLSTLQKAVSKQWKHVN